MTKQSTRAEVNSFVKGLITEASPLNFPVNASIDEENFELNRDGTRQRRLGMQLETALGSYLVDGALNIGKALNSYVWSSPGGDTSKQFLVVQYATKLYFLNIQVTPATLLKTVDLDPGIGVGLSPSPNIKYSMSSVGGMLVVVAGVGTVYAYNFNGNLAAGFEIYQTGTGSGIQVRDFWGVEEYNATLEAQPDFRTTTMTDSHMYNLCNQSWGLLRRNAAGVMVNPVTQHFTDLATYPSNKDVVWTGLQYQPVTPPATPFERMYTNFYEETRGDLLASRGHFIIDLLDRKTGRQTAMTRMATNYPGMPTLAGSLPADFTDGGPTCVTEFGGRAWYGGFSGRFRSSAPGDKRSPILNNYVCFSQIVKEANDLTKCYQEGDPTSRESSEVLDSDGGYLKISGAEQIVAMRPLGTKLIILATNGVWAVSGGSDFGFSATSILVNKISSFGCVAPQSVASEGANLMFWGADAIYAISPNQYGEQVVDDITVNTIQKFYKAIPYSVRATAFGVYDGIEKKFRWVYNTGTMYTSNSLTYELVFDVSLKAFYKNKILAPAARDKELRSCYFTNQNGRPIYQCIRSFAGNTYLDFCAYSQANFLDWVEQDAKAYLLTGTNTAGDSAVKKQAPYLTVHMKTTETVTDTDAVPLNQSSCLMKALWDFADTPASKKFSIAREVYKYRLPLFASPSSTYDSGFYTTVTKNKVRGSGKALSLYFETSPLKDCQIIGWNLTFNGNGIT